MALASSTTRVFLSSNRAPGHAEGECEQQPEQAEEPAQGRAHVGERARGVASDDAPSEAVARLGGHEEGHGGPEEDHEERDSLEEPPGHAGRTCPFQGRRDPPRRPRGVTALAQRAPDHHHVGPGEDRLGRRGHPGLIPSRRAGWPDPGHDEQRPGPHRGPHRRHLVGRAHETARAGPDREPRQPHHRAGGRSGEPDPLERGVVEAGQHGHGQDPEPPRRAPDGRPDHLVAAGRVHREQRRTARCGAARRALDGVGDVVELQVEEDRTPQRRGGANHRRALGHEELEPHLEHPHLGRDGPGEGLGLAPRGEIDRCADPLPWRRGHGSPTCMRPTSASTRDASTGARQFFTSKSAKER